MTKTIDQMAADFAKENPDVKVNPIYSGTYQESIVKALTATKSGKPPQLAVLLSTDMFSLIDEDAIVPIDDIAKSADDKKWLDGFYKSFMMNSRTGGKTWGVPFQRSTIVLYWNKDAFKEAGLDPDKGPANWDQMVEYAKKLTKTDASGNVTQWGVKIPSSGFPYWLFQGLTTPNDVLLMNDAGTETYFDKPAVIEALQYWVDLSAKHKVDAGRRDRVGHDAEGLLREEGGDDLDDDRQPHQHPHQRRASRSASRCCRRRSTRAARPAAATSTSSPRRRRPSSRRRCASSSGRRRRSARRSGASPPAMSR